MTDPLGQSQVIPYLKGLSQLGFEYTILSFEKPERYEKLKLIIKQELDANNIKWIPKTYTKRPPVISTLWDIFQMYQTVLKVHRSEQFDGLHCRSYISALIGNKLKKKTGLPFLFDMRGFWADERVDGGLWKLENPVYRTIYRFFKRKEIEFLTNADHVISLTEAAKSEILSWPALTKKPQITVIPCCVDTAFFNPEKINTTIREEYKTSLSLGNTGPVLSYLGALGTWYCLPEMLSFFSAFLKKYPEAVFLFITQDEHSLVMSEAEKQGIPEKHIRVMTAQRKEIPTLLSLSDLSVFFIKPAYSKKASSPTKQGELMSMNIPVICNSGVGDTKEIVLKYNSGLVMDILDESNFRKVVTEIPELLQKNELHEHAIAYFSLDKGVARYATVLNTILNG